MVSFNTVTDINDHHMRYSNESYLPMALSIKLRWIFQTIRCITRTSMSNFNNENWTKPMKLCHYRRICR